MRTARFFCNTINQDTGVVLTGDQFRHLTKVLRLKNGDLVELFDGDGTIAQAVIDKIEKNLVRLTIKDTKNYPKSQKNRIIIASSIAKGERFEMLVAKCTELGVDRIVPVIFERTVKQSIQQQRLDTIALESAKQCQRLFLPVIDKPADFKDALEKLKIDYPGAKIIFGSLTSAAESIIIFNPDESDIIAFIGPEGGLTEAEEDTLKKINAQSMRLTDTILRVETAAIAFAAVLTAKRILIK
jgi:16S rRNA (uracil1498-N3)-methyltransferase